MFKNSKCYRTKQNREGELTQRSNFFLGGWSGKGLTNKLTLEHRLEGDKRVRHVDYWGEVCSQQRE